jgi:hypothetical protein
MKALWTFWSVTFLPALAAAGERPDFTRDVQPILARRCTACHGPIKQRGGLRLDSGVAIREGGNSGPAVTPGKGASSHLVLAVEGAEGVRAMPPKGPRLSPREITLLRSWVDAGAAAPPAPARGRARAASRHWAFLPVQLPSPPAVRQVGWVQHGLDRFILARLEKKGLRPSPEADRITLLRRLRLDLTGIPPKPQEVEAFLADHRPDAYERAVDRLLASPHYGERWARHWLDAARYADSNGYSIDSPRAIWKYRDWVIAALNRDLPFDRFVVEQLAGDLLPDPTPGQKIATGFHRNTMRNEEGGIDEEQFRVEAVVDRTNTTGTVFLGLTVGCAQCHDHKFDPISQKEYYRLFAFFNNTDEPTLDLLGPDEMRRRRDTTGRLDALRERLKALDGISPAQFERWEGSLSAETRLLLPKPIQVILAIAPNGRNPRQEQQLLDSYRSVHKTAHVAGGLGGPWALMAHARILLARSQTEKHIVRLQTIVPAKLTTLVLNERKQQRQTYVQLGGDFLRKGALVTPGVLVVLPPLPAKSRPTRLDLARWLTDPANPLTRRVTANRVWQHFFGSGLVETENDFGTQGTPPSHPELLDWLATQFTERQWSMKALHRLVVNSATYRQSSRARADLSQHDPRNRLLGRQHRLRLDAEVVRDVALAASGLLTTKVGGPGVYPPQPPGVYSFTQVPRTWAASVGPDRFRRGLYTWFWRSAPHPGLVVFDAPDATAACTRRNRSNTPLQALTLLNDQAFLECAQALAARVLRDSKPDEYARIAHAFRLTLARAPMERERSVLARLLARQRDSLARNTDEARALVPADQRASADLSERAAWTAAARVLLNLDEFITRE